MSDSINTPEFRAAFPKVFEAEKNELSGKMEFSVMMLWPVDADLSGVKNICKQAAIAKWGEDTSKWPEGLKLPFRDQGEKVKKDKNTGMVLKDDSGQPILMDGCVAGALFAQAKTLYQPLVVDENVQSIINPSKFYAGCYAIAAVHAFAWGPTKGGFGVSLGLDAIQKTRDGDPLGGGARVRPETQFAPAAGATEAPAAAAGGATSLFD